MATISPRLRQAALLALALLPLTGCEKTSPPPAATRAPSPQEGTAPAAAGSMAMAASAEPNSFREVTEKLDAGGSLFLYLSTQAWMNGLADQLEPWRQAALDAAPPDQKAMATKGFDLAISAIRRSGLEEISGFGMSRLAVSPEITRSKTFLHHDKSRGSGFLWSLLGPAPHRLETLDLLPAKTAFASFQDLDLVQINELLKKAVARSGEPRAQGMYQQAMSALSGATGVPAEQALKSLVGPAGLILTLDPAQMIQVDTGANSLKVPRPGLVLVLPSRDERIFQQLEQMVMAMPGATKVDEGDLHLRVLAEQPLPFPTPLTLKPALARWGQYLLVASDESLLREIVALKGGSGGFRATPEFAALSQGMPSEGNAFTLLTETFARTISKVQQETMLQKHELPDAQMAALRRVLDQAATGAAYSVSTKLENGWLTTAQTRRTGPKQHPLAPLLAGMMSGLAGAQHSTAANAATAESPEARSLANLKQIALACEMYARDHEETFPPALLALVPQYIPDAGTLRSPFAPEVPEGYRLLPGVTPAAQDPTTIFLEDAHSVASGGPRVVARLNGTSEILK